MYNTYDNDNECDSYQYNQYNIDLDIDVIEALMYLNQWKELSNQNRIVWTTIADRDITISFCGKRGPSRIDRKNLSSIIKSSANIS